MRQFSIVTGCAGFIGYHLCRRLLEQGVDVLGVDEVNDAYDPAFKEWRLELLSAFGKTHFSFARLDISDSASFATAVDDWLKTRGDAQPVVYHLAGRGGVRQSVEKPELYLASNTAGTLTVLKYCTVRGLQKCVLASTSSLYAGARSLPFLEDDDTSRPLTPYAASKKAAECFCYAFHHLHGLDISINRFFTVYGPYGRPDMSVLTFCRRISAGHPITIFGDGLQERDFTYIDDIVSGVIASSKLVGYEVFNLGGAHLHPLQYMVSLLSRELGVTARIEYAPENSADLRRTLASVAKAEQMLGWRPAVSLEEGISRTVEWFQSNRQRLMAFSF